jgi:hypothetical protein
MTNKVEESINRIKKMEEIFDEVQRKIRKMDDEIEDCSLIQSEIRMLEEYYQSEEWKQDFILDENGLLPTDLKRGVLSEDGIYNLLEQFAELDR